MEDRGTDHAGNGGVIISKRPSYTVQATSQLETFMSLYQILIEGRNFLITVEGDCAKHGFLTYRYVEASDPESAGNKAVQMIREAEDLREITVNASDDPPIVNVEGILEITSGDETERIPPNFIYYRENPKRWWQFWKR